jgi:hypothetical protein
MGRITVPTLVCGVSACVGILAGFFVLLGLPATTQFRPDGRKIPPTRPSGHFLVHKWLWLAKFMHFIVVHKPVNAKSKTVEIAEISEPLPFVVTTTIQVTKKQAETMRYIRTR